MSESSKTPEYLLATAIYEMRKDYQEDKAIQTALNVLTDRFLVKMATEGVECSRDWWLGFGGRQFRTISTKGE